jgi:hypothetical protein
MLTLKRIDVLSAAKIFAIVNAIIGVVMGVFIFIVASAFSSFFGAQGIGFLGIGVGIIVVLPVLLFIVGFISVAIEAWLYNLLSKRFGCIKIDLKKNQLKRIDLNSTGKIYAAAGAIVGLVAGIIFAIVGIFLGSSIFLIFGIVSIVAFPLLFALVLFVAVVVGVALYNYIASKFGGVLLFIKNGELKSVSAVSYAKIEGLFGALVGLVEGIIYAVRSAFPSSRYAMPAFAHSFGILSVVAFPIFYFIISFVVALIGAWLYNKIACRWGGVKIVLS